MIQASLATANIVDLSSLDMLESAAQSAEAAWQRGDFGAAFSQYVKAFSQRLTYLKYGLEPDKALDVADFFVLERLSDLAVLVGYEKQADELLKFASSQIRKGGNDYWADILTIKRINLNLGSGLLRDAQELLSLMSKTIGDVWSIHFTPQGVKRWEEACDWSITITASDRSRIFVLLYLVMGQLLAALGQYSNAKAAMEAGLAHRRQRHEISRVYPIPQDLTALAIDWLRLRLAAVQLEAGEVESARASVSELKSSINSQQQPAMWVQTLELEGRINWLSGNLGPALDRFREVLNYCVEKGFKRAALSATLNLADILVLVNQTMDARRHIALVCEEAKAVNDLPLLARAEWLLQVAVARTQSFPNEVPLSVTEQWKPSDAAQLDSEIDTLGTERVDANDEVTVDVNPLELEQSPNYLTLFEERVLGFHWLLAHRDIAGCAHWLAQLREIFRFTDSKLIALRLEVLTGLLEYHRGEFVNAEKLLTAAQLELRRMNLIKELWQVQRILRWCRQRLGRESDRDEEKTTESGTLLRQMADTLQGSDRSFYLLNKWTDEEEGLALLLSRLQKGKNEISNAPWYQRFNLRRQWKAEFTGLLRSLDRYRDVRAEQSINEAPSPDDDAARNKHQELPPRSSIWQRLRRLKWRHASILFLVLPDRVLVVYKTLFAVDFKLINVTRLELRELIREWHEIIAQIRNEEDRDLGKDSRQDVRAVSVTGLLARSRDLSSKLSKQLQISTILGCLHWFTRNLTLVLDDCLHGFPFAAITHEGKYLIEHYAISLAYHEQPTSARLRRSNTALLVGASLKNQGVRPLAFVSEELEAVEALLRRWKLLSQSFDDARPECPNPDKTTILSSLPGTAIAHFACHGLFTPDEPAESGIVLRLRPDREMLTLLELSKVDLSDVRHVTVSACWSADHFIFPGRWIVSLPETLGRAGAASVLGCLWVINDRVGAAFMVQFYRYLQKYGRARALQCVQLDCLNGNLGKQVGVDLRQPIFWAGYQLYGESGRLIL